MLFVPWTFSCHRVLVWKQPFTPSAKGGYGVISEDFSAMMKRLRKGNSRGLGPELKSQMKIAESAGYKRLLNTLYTNVTQNTDLVETLKKQGTRMEEDRSEEVEKYIEELGRCP